MMAPANDRQPVAADTRGIVVFLVWPSLPYTIRMVLGLLLVAAGLILQMVTASFWSGAGPVLAGNLLLLVRGYNNRVDVKRFSPGAEWETVGREQLDEVIRLDKSIRSWDRSLIDVTSVMGIILFVVIAVVLAFAAVILTGFARVIALDAMLLLLPHWLTGVRRILRFPKVVVRAKALEEVLDGAVDMVKDYQLDIMMLLKGDKELRVPDDIKFRVTFAGQDEDFLGLYGQVVINDVQGRSYPYFYVVIVARKGYGLERVSGNFDPPEKMTKEFGADAEVEFIVLRQQTTKTSGYHTKTADALAIFAAGASLGRTAASV